MRKQRKILILVAILLISILIQSKTYANEIIDKLSVPEYTEEYKKYLLMTEEERKSTLLPRMFEIENTNINSKNPFRIARRIGSNIETKFSLKDEIAENVVVKNQGNTQCCWAFSALSSLETNLALKANSKTKIYDFSERHMNYATSRNFANNAINEKGFNRTVKEGGNWSIALSYLTNGMGAIDETEMPFEENETEIELSAIQNKEVTSQVYDTITFPSYEAESVTTEMKQQMKEQIKNNGSIFANIHGASLFSDYYNNETGAIYCDNRDSCPIDHGVSIIGWDDEYAIENFNENHRPTNKGAWIIKNSWGEKIEYTINQMKEEIFANMTEQQKSELGWTQPSDILDNHANEIFKEIGYTIKEEGRSFSSNW